MELILAHGLGGRSDLPLPGWIFAWAAAAVLAISFFAFAALWQTPKLETARAKALFCVPVAIDVFCGLLGVGLFGFLVYAGTAGTQEEGDNLLPSFIYVFVWVALPILSAIFGDVFRPFNPWLAIARFAGWARKRFAPRSGAAQFNYPDVLGRAPAVLLLLAFGYLELISPDGRDPSVLARLMVVYMVLQLAGCALFGTKTWLERGDAFGLYLNFFSRISPLTVQNRQFSLRLPLSGLTDIAPIAGTVAFVCTAIGITAFDGVSVGPLWQSIAGDDPTAIVATLGMLVMCGIVFGFYRLGIEGMKSSHIEMSPRELGMTFAPSLVPIALGYVVAHYFSFLVFQGQALWALASDPLGDGTNWFGTADAAVNYSALSNTAIWWIQVVALVLGHVGGLAVAHDRALAVWGKARAAVQSQMWMLIVMVGFTSLGLWLLSQANQ
jgi:hypothetical protein